MMWIGTVQHSQTFSTGAFTVVVIRMLVLSVLAMAVVFSFVFYRNLYGANNQSFSHNEHNLFLKQSGCKKVQKHGKEPLPR